MNLEFREDALSMMPCGVHTDAELARDRLVRPALRQENGNLLFPGRQSEMG
jgi:hypothetical protein